MKKIIAFLITLVIVNTASAQPTFQARIEEGTAPGSVDLYLRLSGTSPFTASATPGRYIGTAGFPIAVPNTFATPGGISVTLDPNFTTTMSNAGATYTITVNPITSTALTANAGEKYFSINLAADASVTRNLIASGVEFRLLTATFTGANIPNKDSIKLLNVTYRNAPGQGNAQAQVSVQDNLAIEYTDPFAFPSNIFYPKAGRSVNGQAGTIPSIVGVTPGDYNSWSSPIPHPLPITLVSFDAVKADAHSSRITWQTAMEKNSDFYEVERSADAIHFEKVITHMKAAGESSTILDYVTYDRAPLNGDNYYRLRSVDIGGKFAYSEIRKVRFDGIVKEGIALTSNPVGPETKLLITANVDQRIDYTIVDAAGKMVSGGSVDVHAGTDRYEFENLSALAGGTYYLTAKGATINSTLKISKVD